MALQAGGHLALRREQKAGEGGEQREEEQACHERPAPARRVKRVGEIAGGGERQAAKAAAAA